MLALVLEDGPRMVDVPKPQPAAGEALIRVHAAGICNTDLELAKGYMGFRGVPGHEFVGVVEECENPYFLGKRVVGEINCVCGGCNWCQMEMPHHCSNRSVLGILNRNGAFAEFFTLPEANLHLVPDNVPDEIAVFTEPVAAAFRIEEQIVLSANDRVIVLGDGKLGLVVAQVLHLSANKVLCVGKHPEKLALLERLGIDTALADDDVTGDADVVVEATGAPQGLQRALQLVRPEGKIVLKTTVAHPSTLDMSTPVINEVQIIGSRCGPFRPALEALALGTVEVRPMIADTFPLSQAVEALQHAAQPGTLKVLIRVEAPNTYGAELAEINS